MRALAAVVVASLAVACGGAQQSLPKDFEARLKKLEDQLAKREEALAFLEQAYAQQKKQMEQMEESEPDPDSVFAVDIEPVLKAGQVEGSANALVTIVEAWDFA
jgi:multidrug resistance efflux pump